MNGKTLVSYDVVSLFTNVPLQQAIDIATEALPMTSRYSKDIFKQLLALACHNTVFGYEEKLSMQKDGVAMGSPLAPLLANIYLSSLEKRLSDAPVRVYYWRRYVDDTVVILDEGHEDNLLQYINSLSNAVKFTMEKSNDGY